MYQLFEKYADESGSRDGGFVFQAIVSHNVQWSIVNGEVKLSTDNIRSILHQVDVFPDMNFKEGWATSTYVTLSEVNILKRKFELASESIKRLVNPEYAKFLSDNGIKKSLINKEYSELSKKYFENTNYQVQLITNNIVLREVSTSGLDSGNPKITLKLSTGMVDTLDGANINSWGNFKLNVAGPTNLKLTGDELSAITEYDPIDNVTEIVFRTILPSITLGFSGDSVAIDRFTNRSAQSMLASNIDFNNIFKVDDSYTNKK
jgi:hypothetical protein